MVELCVTKNEQPSGSNDRDEAAVRAANKFGDAVHENSSSQWLRTPARWPVCVTRQVGTIDVLAVPLDLSQEALESLKSTLSPAEIRRAGRFHFSHHRDRFIAARGVLRRALAHCLGTEPDKLEFAYGTHGKPELAGAFANSGFKFNLAHCENLALIAITYRRRIGVDLERIRLLRDMSELVSRFFSGREVAAFHNLTDQQKPEAFFNLWTRKEAWLKATGEGISQYLAEVEVSFLPGEAAELLHLPRISAAQGPWSLRELRPAKDFAAAIAFEGEIVEVACRRWESIE